MNPNKRNGTGRNGMAFDHLVEKFHLQPSVASDLRGNIQTDTTGNFTRLFERDYPNSGLNTLSSEERCEQEVVEDGQDSFWKLLTGEVQPVTSTSITTPDNQSQPMDSERTEGTDRYTRPELSNKRKTVSHFVELANKTVTQLEHENLPEPCQGTLKLAKFCLKKYLSKFEEFYWSEEDLIIIFDGLYTAKMDISINDKIYEKCHSIGILNFELAYRPYRREIIFREMENLMMEVLLPLMKDIKDSASKYTPKPNDPISPRIMVKLLELDNGIDLFRQNLKSEIIFDTLSEMSDEPDQYEVYLFTEGPKNRSELNKNFCGDHCSFEGEESVNSDEDDEVISAEVRSCLQFDGSSGLPIKSTDVATNREVLKKVENYIRHRKSIDETIQKMMQQAEFQEQIERFDYEKVVTNLMVLTSYGMEMDTGALMLAECNNEPDRVARYLKSPEEITYENE